MHLLLKLRVIEHNKNCSVTVVTKYLLLVSWPDIYIRKRSHAGYDAGPYQKYSYKYVTVLLT